MTWAAWHGNLVAEYVTFNFLGFSNPNLIEKVNLFGLRYSAPKAKSLLFSRRDGIRLAAAVRKPVSRRSTASC